MASCGYLRVSLFQVEFVGRIENLLANLLTLGNLCYGDLNAKPCIFKP